MNFLHLGIQEYFAAKHVTTLLEDEVYALLKESFIVDNIDNNVRRSDPESKSVRLSNMWILYCGITSGKCNALRHYLTGYGNHYQQHESNDLSMQNPKLFAERDFTTTTNTEQVNNFNSQVPVNKMKSPFQQELNYENRISSTEAISGNILKDPVKVLYLFQCFQEAQDDVLYESLLNSFDGNVINVSRNTLLPQQVVSLGFFYQNHADSGMY